jgi:D-alanyl-D-alanine carboxypeptidase/D-alanyl-D-alanine-endopeptidase (penicillin-binding protein 4)
MYEHRSNHLLIPASNVKIMTSAAALSVLKPDYRFRTALLYDGSMEEGVVKGNVYLKGYGDPKLVPEELWRFVADLKNRGLRKIEGDLVADDSFFDEKRYGTGWGTANRHRAYHAKLGALSLNFNVVNVHVRPGEKVGDPPVVLTDPDTSFITVQNLAKTVGPTKRRQGIHFQIDVQHGSRGDIIRVSGGVPMNFAPRRYYRTVSNPPLYAATVFREYLTREGISVSGETRIGETPPEAPVLHVHQSAPLSQVVADLNKFSNNFVAEQILKTLGAERFGNPGSDAKGLEVVEEFLAGLGIQKGNFTLVDGSGLSPLNRLTPAQIVTVLRAMHRELRFRPEFVSSFATMGVDGSVKNRIGESDVLGSVRVKTGTLNQASCLSGYLETREGELVAFSLLMNGPCSVREAQRIQDRIVLEVIRLARDRGPSETTETKSR